MRKLLSFCVCFGLMVCLAGCSLNVNEIALQSNYTVDNQNDFVIGEESGLGLKLLEYSDIDTKEKSYAYVLAYLNDETMIMDTENAYVKSLIAGKTCISITSTILDVGRQLNEGIIIDLLNRLNNQMNDENIEKVSEKLTDGAYYIISKNDSYVFIDYLTTIPNVFDKVMYSRFIVQDVSMLDVEITEEENAILSDYLPELLSVLKIEESIELPKK